MPHCWIAVMAQVVENLPSKCEALSSNSSTTIATLSKMVLDSQDTSCKRELLATLKFLLP
jgi:hypothetical protein